MAITIDPEFQAMIPPLTDEEREQLEANLVAHGCRDPLVVWEGEGILLDGHHRHEICGRLGIEYGLHMLGLADRDAAREWIILNQFGRRNLNAMQRSELSLLLKSVYVEQAKARQREAGGPNPGRKALPAILPGAVKGDSRDALAKIAGVGGRTISKVEKILELADEETLTELRKGETTINAVYNELRSEKPKPRILENSGYYDWYTPPRFIEVARGVMGGIDCDPASSAVANKIIKAKTFFTIEDNGLSKTWGKRIWLNPPYQQPDIVNFIDAVVDKRKSGEIDQAVIIVNNATETRWGQKLLAIADAVCFIKSRVNFLNSDGEVVPGSSLQGQMLIYLGDNGGKFAQAIRSRDMGVCFLGQQ